MTSSLPGIRVQPAGNAPSRRSFLRYTGASAALGSLWLASCKKDNEPVARPTITSFTPTSGMAGTTVTVTGSRFTGATAVQLGGVSTSYTVLSDTSLTFVVPTGISSGLIVVGTPSGPVSTADPFIVTTTPVLTAVNVGTGDVGVLNYAYALEQLEAAFYTTLRTGTYYTGLSATSAERQILDDLYYHEVIHRDFFKTAITAAGATPIKALTPNFAAINFNDRTSVLSTA
ncbi:ferritin-like domain-containing protein, partial [Hymenobacter arcticus]